MFIKRYSNQKKKMFLFKLFFILFNFSWFINFAQAIRPDFVSMTVMINKSVNNAVNVKQPYPADKSEELNALIMLSVNLGPVVDQFYTEEHNESYNFVKDQFKKGFLAQVKKIQKESRSLTYHRTIPYTFEIIGYLLMAGDLEGFKAWLDRFDKLEKFEKKIVIRKVLSKKGLKLQIFMKKEQKRNLKRLAKEFKSSYEICLHQINTAVRDIQKENLFSF